MLRPKTMSSPSDLTLEKYSFTKLTTFEQCPYQYYLKYIKSQSGEDNAMSEYGVLCHSLLEDYFKGKIALWDLPEQYLAEYNRCIKHPFPEMFNIDLEEKYYNGGYEFFKNFDGLDGCTIYGIEQEFCLTCEDKRAPFLFRGYIDLEYRDENGALILHDWKSKSQFKSKKELAKYARQLYLYSRYMYESGMGFPDILRFYCFRGQKPYDIPFNKDDYDKAWDWAYKTVADIREAEMFLQDRSSIFMCEELCDYRYSCKEKDIGFAC